MNYTHILLLAFLQGTTEFLPVSSSAHLVIAESLLKTISPGILLEVVLHMGTLISILIYFRTDLWKLFRGALQVSLAGSDQRREIGNLALATLPAVFVGLALSDTIDQAFQSPRFTGLMLLATTIILYSTRYVVRKDRDQSISWGIALAIGISQAIAILPGISRSGITIATALWLGLSAKQSARFSFLLAIPALIGAGILKLPDILSTPGPTTMALIVGLIAAAAVGYGVIAWFMKILVRQRLHLFAGYTLILGSLVIAYF